MQNIALELRITELVWQYKKAPKERKNFVDYETENLIGVATANEMERQYYLRLYDRLKDETDKK